MKLRAGEMRFNEQYDGGCTGSNGGAGRGGAGGDGTGRSGSGRSGRMEMILDDNDDKE